MIHKTLRVRADLQPMSVVHPSAEGARITLKPGDPYDSKDEIVRAYPWAFAADNVEQTTAAPGERRSTRPS